MMATQLGSSMDGDKIEGDATHGNVTTPSPEEMRSGFKKRRALTMTLSEGLEKANRNGWLFIFDWFDLGAEEVAKKVVKGATKATGKVHKLANNPVSVVKDVPDQIDQIQDIVDCVKDTEIDDLVVAKTEFEDIDNALSLKYYPIFMTLQAVVGVGFWFILNLLEGDKKEGESFWSNEAGLDSIPGLKGRTKLMIHTLDCEDLRHNLWYQVFTYQFTHVGVSHVLSNLLLLVVIGCPQECYHGHWRVALIFNSGVVCGALAFVVSDCHSSVVGMSGGCYALIGMMWANLIVNWRHKRFRKMQCVSLVLLTSLDFVHAAVNLSMYGSAARTSFSAHIGGLATGLIAGTLYGKRKIPKRFRSGFTWAWVAFLCLLGVAALCVAIFYVRKWPPQEIWEPTAWCWAKSIWHPDIFRDDLWHCVRCGHQECIDAWSSVGQEGGGGALADISISWCHQNGGWAYTNEWSVVPEVN